MSAKTQPKVAVLDLPTETHQTRHTFSQEERLTLGDKMALAQSTITGKMDELKSVSTTIKADIASQEAALNSLAEKLRSGYEFRSIECYVDYRTQGRVKFIEKATGAIVEERELTEEEQLKLVGARVDAEKVVRDASAAEG